MRSLLFVIAALAGSAGFSAEVSFSLRSFDTALAKIANHAQEFPPRFTSTAERKQIEADLRDLLTTLNAAVIQYPDDPEILFRDGFANAMGHNLNFEGCAVKYFKAFDRLLELKPDDKRANYNYGAFLVATAARQKDGVMYLEKALALGVFDAHYTLGFAYLVQGDKPKALLHFKEYAKLHPENDQLKRNIAEIEQATIRIVSGPPPNFDETTKKKDPDKAPEAPPTVVTPPAAQEPRRP
jgi:tetratricopeptide (TPR) repeat protein